MYWIALGILMSLISGLLIVRGIQESLFERIRLAKSRINRPIMVGLGLFTAMFLLFGFKIYHDENTKNDKPTSKQIELARAYWEITYKQYEKIPQPFVMS